MGFQCNSCGCNDNNEIDTQQQVETGRDNNNNQQDGAADRNKLTSQMEKQGMQSQNNHRQSRMKEQNNNRFNNMAGYGDYNQKGAGQTSGNTGGMDMAFYAKHINLIVKFQALFRGHLARRNTAFIMKSKRADSRYFTVEESRETVSKDRPYDPNAKREKRPTYTFKTGATYSGEWIGGFRDGYGEQQWPDGARYEGQWKDNRAHGKGKFTHIDGDIYEGDWVNDKANGYGVYHHINGAMYEGYWRDDLQHGTGKESWTDGSIYEGEYMAGKKHGIGLYSWNDGSKYQGEWYENKIKGFGTYSWLDGRQFQGEWLDNNMHGMGVYTWADGRCYMGEYQDDKKHGYGIYKWADGRIYMGQWMRGKQHGLGVYQTIDQNNPTPTVTIKHGLWEEGKRIEWFDKQSLDEINNGQKDFRNFFRKPENQQQPEYYSFNKPDYFDQRLSEIYQRFGIQIEYGGN